jgi:hypothetical protein
MLRAGVCINCAEKTAALILESGPGEIAVEPCSGACREAIALYFSTPPERWRARTPLGLGGHIRLPENELIWRISVEEIRVDRTDPVDRFKKQLRDNDWPRE